MRKNNLCRRIIAAFNFVIYGKGKVRIMTCGKCGSQAIVPISKNPEEVSYVKDEIHIDLAWSEFTQCLKCGSVCEEIQLWNFNGEPTKINNNIIVK